MTSTFARWTLLVLLTACGAPAPMPAGDAQVFDAPGGTDAAVDVPDTATVDVGAAPDTSADADALDAGPLPVCCPVDVTLVEVAEGEEALPQTTLHFKPLKLATLCGKPVVKWQWTMKQPPGTGVTFVPSSAVSNPTVTANAAGEYEFCVVAWNGDGVKSCQPQCVDVLIVPNNVLHVELLWDTPSDADQFDTGPTAGADLDLHFTHANASGSDIDCDGSPDPWFSNPFDCFWFNPFPHWDDLSTVDDDPEMELDDTDGAGPENLDLASPANHPYSIGVHYWNDHGFGTSLATVRVFMQGVLMLEYSQVEMHNLDMWYVGRLNWPNSLTGGTAQPFDTCWQTGDACLAKTDPTNPKGGKLWQPSGQHCITPCYASGLSGPGVSTAPCP
jgi:hypothetical protein